MKIGFVTNVCPHFQVKFFEKLAALHDVEFFFTGGNESYRHPRHSIELGRFNGRYLPGFAVAPKLRVVPSLLPLLLRGRYEAIVGSIDGRFTLPVTYAASRILRIPFVLWTGLWSHPQTPFHRLSWPLVRLLYERSDSIIVYGEHVRRYLASLGVDPRKIFCAWHAADNELFNAPVSEEERRMARVAAGVPEGKIVLFVGRLDAVKGLHVLLEAVAGLNRPDVHLVLVGDGEEREALLRSAGTLSFKNLHLIPYCENSRLRPLYSLADVFVLPSLTKPHFKEPWGIVVNEAMNQGKPIITTDAVGAGVGGLVRAGENGYVVAENDIGALREALEKVLADPEVALRMGRRSLEIIEGWTIDRMAAGACDALEWATRMNGTPETRRAAPRENRESCSKARV